jgi:hypothetical protein
MGSVISQADITSVHHRVIRAHAGKSRRRPAMRRRRPTLAAPIVIEVLMMRRVRRPAHAIADTLRPPLSYFESAKRASQNGERNVTPRSEIIGPDGECHGHRWHGSPSLLGWLACVDQIADATRSLQSNQSFIPDPRKGDTIMSTKFNVAAFAAVLAVLAAPGVVSAQEGFGNYPSVQSLRDIGAASADRSQPQVNRFAAKVPSNAYGSVVGSAAIVGNTKSLRGRAFDTDPEANVRPR